MLPDLLGNTMFTFNSVYMAMLSDIFVFLYIMSPLLSTMPVGSISARVNSLFLSRVNFTPASFSPGVASPKSSN